MVILDRFNRPKVDLVDLFPLMTWQVSFLFFMVSFFGMFISHLGSVCL